MHVGRHRTGSIQRDKGCDIVKFCWGEASHQTSHWGGFQLEHPQRIARLEQLECFLVVEWYLVDVDFFSGRFFNQT